MPCESLRNGQSKKERDRDVKVALARLETYLKNGQVSLGIGTNGAIVFRGWDKTARNGVSDVCAYRKLAIAGSWELKQAQARAELLTGRKVDAKLVASGLHSHDGGKTWSKD